MQTYHPNHHFHYASLVVIALIVVLLAISSCELRNRNCVPRKDTTEFYFYRDLVVDKDDTLTLPPGTYCFADTAEIKVYGSLQFRGTESSPIQLRPMSSLSKWGGIRMHKAGEICTLENVHISNALIKSWDVHVVIKKCKVLNDRMLAWDDALCRVIRGGLQIEDSHFQSNNTGEGVLVQDIQSAPVLIQNNEFEGVPDGIEFISVNSGIINGNHLRNNKDDAIDLNGCYDIIISNNNILNSTDNGIEIGSENFGSSHRINVQDNVICKSGVGILVKEGASVMCDHNTFFNNAVNISCLQYTDGYEGSSVFISNSIFSNAHQSDFRLDSLSVIRVEHSLSDSELHFGRNNIWADPLFRDLENMDLSPDSASPCIDAGNPNFKLDPDRSITDIGARRWLTR